MSISRRHFASAISAAALATSISRRADAQNPTVFRHGVASGDPLVNRVIIWTRITPPADEELLAVEWSIAADPAFNRVLQRGMTYTNSFFDYTVKVDVTRLDPGTTYYYRFNYRGSASPIGRTKTLPAGQVDRLRLAFLSCSNYPYGFFNAYRAVASRLDLDAVLHLGDYIYEYGNTEFGDGTAINRVPSPNKEIVALEDYRMRHAQYRTDPDLQEVHRQHPFIIVWDDHESTNNSYRDGAENHQPATEGDWSVRRAVSIQAWFEWMPVREQPFQGTEIYRTFRFGNLVDLIMLDTRLSGRDAQVANNSPALADPSRSLLGVEQEQWLYQQLNVSKSRGTRWRILGQQVMMGQLLNPDGSNSVFNPDQWDGYQASRARLLGYLGANQVDNVVVLTGDIHSSWGNEISVNPFSPTQNTPQAVEFVTPAVTSPGIDDAAQAAQLQTIIGATHPHVKYVDLFRRGYAILDINRDRTQCEWYHVRTLTQRSPDQDFARALLVENGTNRLTAATQPTAAGSGTAPAAP
ncbi:MAG TPA: alkaline phosphatase D family protein [Bryobacteraceae bacterium]|nr:alkaline phosphatase D family protein [Bryobacteraceae bacterium]